MPGICALFLAVTLATVAGCAGNATTESTGEFVDDSVITTKVKAEILNQPPLNVTEIKVETFKGTVRLSGIVSSQVAMDRAVAVARHVNGVKSVVNNLKIK